MEISKQFLEITLGVDKENLEKIHIYKLRLYNNLIPFKLSNKVSICLSENLKSLVHHPTVVSSYVIDKLRFVVDFETKESRSNFKTFNRFVV